jgi:lysophospholipase L1-like esterase
MAAFSDVVVFGDSLVDPGNALKAARLLSALPFTDLPGGAPTPDKGYFEGRFTDGFNFADLISNKLVGEPTRPTFPYGFETPLFGATVPFVSKPAGPALSFAYGGAQVRRGAEDVPDLDDQTDIYDNYTADPNALYIVTLGGNDVRELVPPNGPPALPSTATARLSSAAEEMQEEVRELYAAGARHILVTGVPDIGILPDYNGAVNEAQLRALGTQYSGQFEAMIHDRLSALSVPEGGRLYTYSLKDLADRVIADPSAFAMTELRQARTEAQTGGLDAVGAGFLMFDEVHPSAQAHSLIAAGVLGLLAGGVADAPVALQTAPKWIAALEAVGGPDVFAANLVAGQTYTFDLLGISSGAGSLADPVLRLLGDGGKVLVEDDDSGLGLNARLSFTAPTTGDYTLEASGVGVSKGSYALQGLALQGSDVTVQGSVADDLIKVVAGRNYLRGNEGADSIVGGSGFDDINGNMGADTVAGGAGDDWTVGGRDDDRLFGEGGDDIVYGNLGNDTCDGGAGADIIRGGQGDDILEGGAGADFLSGDRGDDTVTGGAGADLFHTFGEAGLDRILDFDPTDGDRVMLQSGTTWFATQAEGDVVIAMGGGGQLVLVSSTLSLLPAGWIFGY